MALRYSLTRSYCTRNRAFKEVKIPADWGHIAGRWWEPFDKRPILALHGWQDSCGSFDRLVPLLSDKVGVLAIDLPGHGYSSRFPPGSYYHKMDQPLIIKHIAQYFNWSKVSLMGHSLGGISAYIYAMVFPKIIDFVICLDSFMPAFRENFIKNIAAGLQEQVKLDKLSRSPEEPPTYLLEDLQKKFAGTNGNVLDMKHVHHILDRNMTPSKRQPGQYYISNDARLSGSLAFNWPHHDLIDGARLIQAPIFIAKSKCSGYFQQNKENLYELVDILKCTSKDGQYHYIDGGHYAHLNNPKCLSELLNNFIQNNNTEDRTTGVLTRDIVSQ